MNIFKAHRGKHSNRFRGVAPLIFVGQIVIGLAVSSSSFAASPGGLVNVTAEVPLSNNKGSVQVLLPTPKCETRVGGKKSFHIYHVLISPNHLVSGPYEGRIVRTVHPEEGGFYSPFLMFRGKPGKNIEIEVPGGVPASEQEANPGMITMWIHPQGEPTDSHLPGGILSVHISGSCETRYTPKSAPVLNYQN